MRDRGAWPGCRSTRSGSPLSTWASPVTPYCAARDGSRLGVSLQESNVTMRTTGSRSASLLGLLLAAQAGMGW